MSTCSTCDKPTSGGQRCRSCSNRQIPRRIRKCVDGVSICTSPTCDCDGRKGARCKLCGELKPRGRGKKCTSPRCRQLRRYETDLLIESWLLVTADATAPEHQQGLRKTLAGWAREYLLVEADWSCTQCGWNTPHPKTGKPPLEVDHIDGDRWNNKRENLRVLCPNCHALTPTFRRMNQKNRKDNGYK